MIRWLGWRKRSTQMGLVSRINKDTVRQFLRFGLVGISGVAVNLTAFSVCLAAGADYQTAAIVAFLLAVSHNFYWNARWTFRLLAMAKRSLLSRYACFVLISAGCLFLNLRFLTILIEAWALSPLLAQVGAVLAVGAINFWLQSVLTFKGADAAIRAQKAVSNE